MARPAHKYRTAAFHGPETESGQPRLFFWAFEPTEAEDFGHVREYEIGVSYRFITRITKDVPVREAFKTLIATEKDAAEKMFLADEREHDVFIKLGEDYHQALPYRQHPVHLADARQAALKRQAAPRRDKLRLKSK